MKILHVETGMNLYGGALQVHYLLKGLAGLDDVENTLVCPEGSAISRTSREYSHKVQSVAMRGDLDVTFIPTLLGIIRREIPDIIHLHSRRGADVLGGIAARLSGKRCILTRRVDNPENRLWASLKYRLYQRVITISDGIMEILVSEGVPSGKITCVHSAVHTGAYQVPCDNSWFREEFGLGEGEYACGVAAQLIERKGHRYLMEAIPGILQVQPRTRFLIFGKGPLEDDLKVRCRRLGIEEKIIFTGFRSDLERILGCLDLLIHPALMEGLGVSLLQAAAAGIPIVASRVGGIPEIVHDGVNGYLVPPGDSSALADAVVRILGDRDLAGKLGENGRRIVEEQFSIENMVEGNLRVYREVMGLESRV